MNCKAFDAELIEEQLLLCCKTAIWGWSRGSQASSLLHDAGTLTLEEPLCRLPVPVELVVEAAGLGSTDDPSSST